MCGRLVQGWQFSETDRQADGGFGSQILWYQGVIYVLGTDTNWWRWTGSTWTVFGPSSPSCLAARPRRSSRNKQRRPDLACHRTARAVPGASSVTDNSLNVWTIGSGLAILRNGSSADGGYGFSDSLVSGRHLRSWNRYQLVEMDREHVDQCRAILTLGATSTAVRIWRVTGRHESSWRLVRDRQLPQCVDDWFRAGNSEKRIVGRRWIGFSDSLVSGRHLRSWNRFQLVEMDREHVDRLRKKRSGLAAPATVRSSCSWPPRKPQNRGTCEGGCGVS